MIQYYIDPLDSTKTGEIENFDNGFFMIRDGYRKIDIEGVKMPIIAVVFFSNILKKKLYIPLKSVSLQVKEVYKEKFVELSHQ